MGDLQYNALSMDGHRRPDCNRLKNSPAAIASLRDD